jgi:L-ribulose-5-phosphate 3-epimerase
MRPTISFMSANFVAREVGYRMTDWRHGEEAVHAAFRPLETYAARFGELLDEVVALGFGAVDIWLAHLEPGWESDEHVAIARAALDERGLAVASLAGGFGATPEEVERTCRLARALGTDLLGGNSPLLHEDRDALVELLNRYDLRFAIENHPERTPDEVLAKIGDGAGGRIGTAVDTGWYGTQGYDAARAIRELGPHVMHVHLKDVRAAGTHECCRFGQGVVPIRECVRALTEIGYEGPISVEHEPNDYDPRPEIREGLAMLRGWLSEGA